MTVFVDDLICPLCRGPLAESPEGLRCACCGRAYPVVDGIPDLFISLDDEDAIDRPNQTWLDPRVVAARDTVYRLCARELKGMQFCMREIGRRTYDGCRVLEIGMGTGHFTRWLAEASAPGTRIDAFDFSWPIIEVAKASTRGLPDVRLLRANARGRLPFPDEQFDIVFARLAPLGAHGVTKVQAAYPLLKPGGWFFDAGWEQTRYETPPTDWALQHGYAQAEHHTWQYRRRQTRGEVEATLIERTHLAAMGCERAAPEPVPESERAPDGSVLRMTHEHLTIAQKPQ